MKSLFIEKKQFPYDGTQLRSLYGYLDHGVQGDSVIAWIGPCSVSFAHMVDGEDLLAGATIAGGSMVHFIIEKFHQPLFSAVCLQRLFAAICLEVLRELSPSFAGRLKRSGDDLYLGGGLEDGKLSISIATVSPVSSLIHFAINCTNDGTPVKTAALLDLNIEPHQFTKRVLARLTSELASIEEATVKVRWVK